MRLIAMPHMHLDINGELLSEFDIVMDMQEYEDLWPREHICTQHIYLIPFVIQYVPEYWAYKLRNYKWNEADELNEDSRLLKVGSVFDEWGTVLSEVLTRRQWLQFNNKVGK